MLICIIRRQNSFVPIEIESLSYEQQFRINVSQLMIVSVRRLVWVTLSVHHFVPVLQCALIDALQRAMNVNYFIV